MDAQKSLAIVASFLEEGGGFYHHLSKRNAMAVFPWRALARKDRGLSEGPAEMLRWPNVATLGHKEPTH